MHRVLIVKEKTWHFALPVSFRFCVGGKFSGMGGGGQFTILDRQKGRKKFLLLLPVQKAGNSFRLIFPPPSVRRYTLQFEGWKRNERTRKQLPFVTKSHGKPTKTHLLRGKKYYVSSHQPDPPVVPGFWRLLRSATHLHFSTMGTASMLAWNNTNVCSTRRKCKVGPSLLAPMGDELLVRKLYGWRKLPNHRFLAKKTFP